MTSATDRGSSSVGWYGRLGRLAIPPPRTSPFVPPPRRVVPVPRVTFFHHDFVAFFDEPEASDSGAGDPVPASTPPPPALLVVLARFVKLEPVLVLVVLVEVIGEFAIGEVVVADLIVPPAAAPTTPSTAAAAAEPGRPSSGFV